jgi:Ca-activated chloride channel family protein
VADEDVPAPPPGGAFVVASWQQPISSSSGPNGRMGRAERWWSRRGPVAIVAVAVVAVVALIAVMVRMTGDRDSATSPNTSATVPMSVPTVLILDASGSMNQADAPGPRIDAAKTAARELVAALPDAAILGLTTYGASTGSSEAERAAGCLDVETLMPLSTLDRDQMQTRIAGLTASGFTPIGLALRTAVGLLPPDESAQAIVLVSDGEDTCERPPCDEAALAKRTHPNLSISTVGFKTDGPASDQLRCIADTTGGLFVQADNAEQLTARLIATQNVDAATAALSADGIGDVRLGDRLVDIRQAHPDFPEGSTSDDVVLVWRDCDFGFANGVLDSIAPHDGGHTIDGVRQGTRLGRATELYGSPLATIANGDGSHSLFYAANDSNPTAYRILVEDFAESGGTVTGTVRSIVLCRCKPKPPLSLPAAPPQSGSCPGMIKDHSDIDHPTLGPVRIFLLWNAPSDGPADGCIVGVAASGKVITPIPVSVYADSPYQKNFAFADPATDATGNTFITYNPGRYDGVFVLVPSADGFEDMGWDKEDVFYTGRRAYYYAELEGPGSDGKYAIAQSENDCDPDCASGSVTTTTLRWDGHDYVA